MKKNNKKAYIKAVLAYNSCSVREVEEKRALYKGVITEAKKCGIDRKQRLKDVERLQPLGYKLWQQKTGKWCMLLVN